MFFAHIHFFWAGSVVWFLHPVAQLQFPEELQWVDPRVGTLPSAEHLPTCHTIGPLEGIQENMIMPQRRGREVFLLCLECVIAIMKTVTQ